MSADKHASFPLHRFVSGSQKTIFGDVVAGRHDDGERVRGVGGAALCRREAENPDETLLAIVFGLTGVG